MNEKQKELCARIYDDTGIDAAYIAENDKPDDVDSFMETMQERVSEIEVIYYHNAIEYLAENDASLSESMGLAHDMGYTVDKINSELLATLLKQQNAGEKIEEFRDEIEELFFTPASV